MICCYCLPSGALPPPPPPPLPAVTSPRLLAALFVSALAAGHEESWDWIRWMKIINSLCVASLSPSSSDAYWKWMTHRTGFRLERTSSSASKDWILHCYSHSHIYRCLYTHVKYMINSCRTEKKSIINFWYVYVGLGFKITVCGKRMLKHHTSGYTGFSLLITHKYVHGLLHWGPFSQHTDFFVFNDSYQMQNHLCQANF